jgi:hypothetical protein
MGGKVFIAGNCSKAYGGELEATTWKGVKQMNS